jgi:hypothetical protein
MQASVLLSLVPADAGAELDGPCRSGRAVVGRGASWKPGRYNGRGDRERGRDGAHIGRDNPSRSASSVPPVRAAAGFRHHPRGDPPGCALCPLDRCIGGVEDLLLVRGVPHENQMCEREIVWNLGVRDQR